MIENVHDEGQRQHKSDAKGKRFSFYGEACPTV
jgi:hypothetical protein